MIIKLKLKTTKDTSEWYYEFVVFEHTLGVKSVEIKEDGDDEFVQLSRTSYNTWSFRTDDDDIPFKFPLTASVYSIAGDYVDIPNLTGEKEKEFEAETNFPIPTNKYFDYNTLEMYDKPKEAEECCSLIMEDYKIMYKDYLLGAYKSWGTYDLKFDETNDPFEGNYCIKANAIEWGVLIFGINWPIRTDQYTHIHFAIKGEKTCENCITVKTYKSDRE